MTFAFCRPATLAALFLASWRLCAASAQLSVDAGLAGHPISPWIYGINYWKDNGLQSMMRIPLVRWGGD